MQTFPYSRCFHWIQNRKLSARICKLKNKLKTLLSWADQSRNPCEWVCCCSVCKLQTAWDLLQEPQKATWPPLQKTRNVRRAHKSDSSNTCIKVIKVINGCKYFSEHCGSLHFQYCYFKPVVSPFGLATKLYCVTWPLFQTDIGHNPRNDYCSSCWVWRDFKQPA